MKKINLAALVYLFLMTAIFSFSLSVKKSSAQEQNLAVCQSTRHTTQIYNSKIIRVPNNNNSCSIANGNPVEKGQLKKRVTLGNPDRIASTSNSVTGTITYRQRIALLPGAAISLKLLDVSRQDATPVISEQTITTAGEQVPIPFKLIFNPAKIQASHSYTVRAEIRMHNELVFTTTKSYFVITNGYPREVELVLEQVDPQSLQNQLMSGEWLLEDLGGAGVIDNLQTTLKFNSDRLTGSGGCNRYFATYQLHRNQLKVSQIGATQKACSSAVMNQESRYFKALRKAHRIRLDKEFLLIDCQGLDKPLKFTRIQASSS